MNTFYILMNRFRVFAVFLFVVISSTCSLLSAYVYDVHVHDGSIMELENRYENELDKQAYERVDSYNKGESDEVPSNSDYDRAGDYFDHNFG